MNLGLCALALAFSSGAASSAPRWEATLSRTGSLALRCDGKDYGSLDPGLFEATWRGASIGGSGDMTAMAAGDARKGTIRSPGGTEVDVETRAAAQGGGVTLQYRLTPRKAIRLNSLHVSLQVPAPRLAGGSFRTDATRGKIPSEFGSVHVASGNTRVLAVKGTDGRELVFTFETPTPVLLQDDRQWGPTMSVRIGPQLDGGSDWPAGRSLDLAMTITGEGGMGLDYDNPVTITAGPDWAPLDVDLDVEAGSALDFANVTPWHAPSGKLGRVIATPSGGFAFASRPAEPVRFYGVNLCFSANYLDHEQSDRLATRLRRLGYNAVRFHHHESEMIDRTGGTSVRPDPAKLDQIDYLFAALKKVGIYITTDLYVSRPVFAAEVWPGEQGDVGMDEFKMAIPVNERVYANYTAFIRAFLGHTNPYTNMTWAADPTLFCVNLINEGNPGNFVYDLTPRLKADYTAAWNRWLAARYPADAALARALGKAPTARPIPLPERDDTSAAGLTFQCFLADNQRAFYRRAKAMVRGELKSTMLLTNMNAWSNPVQIEAIRGEFDYVDDHFYVDHPEFIERPWSLPSRCANSSPVAAGAPGGRGLAGLRVFGKPMACTEFNYSGPGRFRGVGGILTGAMGAVQDWGALWRFAYSHVRAGLFQPGAAGYFDVAGDPLNQAAERAAICLFRRGDLASAQHSVGVVLDPAKALQDPDTTRDTHPDWSGLEWLVKVGVVVGKPTGGAAVDIPAPASPVAGAIGAFEPGARTKLLAEAHRRGWVPASNATDLDGPVYQSANGQVTIDGRQDTMRLDTPRTAGGYARAGTSIHTGAVDVTIQDTDATVWVSSVDGKPITTSKRLLVTHLTDLQNTGARYGDRDRRVLLDFGGLPHLVRAGRATVVIRMANAASARAYTLATSGKRLAPLPVKATGNALTIDLASVDNGKGRMLYEVAID